MPTILHRLAGAAYGSHGHRPQENSRFCLITASNRCYIPLVQSSLGVRYFVSNEPSVEPAAAPGPSQRRSLFTDPAAAFAEAGLAGQAPSQLPLISLEVRPAVSNQVQQIKPNDNVLVALVDLKAGQTVSLGDRSWTLTTDVAAKHKFAMQDLDANAPVYLYGVLVARTTTRIETGAALTTQNVVHDSARYERKGTPPPWTPPDVSRLRDMTFDGYLRADGRVGTQNLWLVVPLVMCENPHIEYLREALLGPLGYAAPNPHQAAARELAQRCRASASPRDVLGFEMQKVFDHSRPDLAFPNVDGIKFLTHGQGCGETRADAQRLCGLLAGYLNHPNVAGATILALGCEHAQKELLEAEIHRRNPEFHKPLYFVGHQSIGSRDTFLELALKFTYLGLMEANQCRRSPAPLEKLVIGVKCGGSDGFSGITANPAMGYTSDLLVALGGGVVLAEFPELVGAEQWMIDRCVRDEDAAEFIRLMQRYEATANFFGTTMASNPSPGNIADGLITDGIKSAGAAQKAGTSLIQGVMDYPGWVSRPGLHLLCTPGNDLISCTAMAAAGCHIIIFSTGLGATGGNPVASVLKVATNDALAERMPHLIDHNAGAILRGSTIELEGVQLLELVQRTAGGLYLPKAALFGQEHFLPWSGVAL
jgi:altronate hydrolase